MPPMTKVQDRDNRTLAAAVSAVARDLVSLKSFGPSHFVSLPLLYPDGSSVTVKIDQLKDGVRVSDNGFAYRKIEAVGADRSFGGVARRIAEEESVEANRRVIFADVEVDALFGAICDVGAASWRVTDYVYRGLTDAEEDEIVDEIEITPEMIEAGAAVLCHMSPSMGEPDYWAEEVYRAMMARLPRDRRTA